MTFFIARRVFKPFTAIVSEDPAGTRGAEAGNSARGPRRWFPCVFVKNREDTNMRRKAC